MGFFDLNIPYLEASPSSNTILDKTILKTARLKLVIKVMELGYTGVAYNRTIKGVMSDADYCSISLLSLTSILKLAPSLSSSVKLHRDLLGVPMSSPFRQYTRLTVLVDCAAQATALNSGNPILKTYNLVAVRPMNQIAFEQACQVSEVDIIAIDFSEKLPFRLKLHMVKAAIQRGIYFEVTYSNLIADVQTRRQMISNAKLLVDWTRGKNLIFTSAAPSVNELRGPYDVANLVSLLGLSMECAKAAISKNCRTLIAYALRKKQCYKEAIRVEVISSGEQCDSKELWFSDWLKWDPISSGDGDLLLDDMAKSFSASNKVSKTVKAIDFASIVDSIPSHGLRVKDLKSGSQAVLQSPDIGKNLVSAAKVIDVLVATNGVSEQPETDQTSLNNTPPIYQTSAIVDSFPSHGLQVKDLESGSQAVLQSPDIGKNFVSAAEMIDVLVATNGVSEQPEMDQTSLNNTPPSIYQTSAIVDSIPSHGLQVKDMKSGSQAVLQSPDIGKNCVSAAEMIDVLVATNGVSEQPETDQTSLNNTPSIYQTSTCEDSQRSFSPNNALKVFTNTEEIRTHATTTEEGPKNSNGLDVYFDPIETEMHDLQLQNCIFSCEPNVVLQDEDVTFHTRSRDNEFDAACSDDAFSPSNNDSAFQNEESERSKSFDVVLGAQNVAMDEVLTGIDINNQADLSLASSTMSLHKLFLKREQIREPRDDEVLLAEREPFVESYDEIKGKDDSSVANHEQLQDVTMEEQQQGEDHTEINYPTLVETISGKNRAKQRTPQGAILFPFKRLLNPIPFKKKARKFKTKIKMV